MGCLQLLLTVVDKTTVLSPPQTSAVSVRHPVCKSVLNSSMDESDDTLRKLGFSKMVVIRFYLVHGHDHPSPWRKRFFVLYQQSVSATLEPVLLSILWLLRLKELWSNTGKGLVRICQIGTRGKGEEVVLSLGFLQEMPFANVTSVWVVDVKGSIPIQPKSIKIVFVIINQTDWQSIQLTDISITTALPLVWLKNLG